MKKLFTLLLSITLFTALFINAVFCEETIYTENGLQYVIEDDTISIVCYYLDDDIVIIPRTIGLYDVTTIKEGTFKNNNIKKVYLPDTITSIEDDTLNTIEIVHYDIYDNPEQDIIDEANRKKEDSNNSYEESITESDLNTLNTDSNNKTVEDVEIDLEEEIIEDDNSKKETSILEKANDKLEEAVANDSNNTLLYILIGLGAITTVSIIVIIKVIKNRK